MFNECVFFIMQIQSKINVPVFIHVNTLLTIKEKSHSNDYLVFNHALPKKKILF